VAARRATAADALARVRAQWLRRRGAFTVGASIAASVVLVAAVAGKWSELRAGVTGAPIAVVALAVALQALALVSRSEAWYGSVSASGGTVSRRRLYRASSMGFVGNLINTQLGAAARIATLRRSAPAETPGVPTLVAAELPILVVEAALAALTSFTLVGPLGLPWWLPLALLAAVVGTSAVVRGVAAANARWLHSGLAVLGSRHGRVRLVGFVLVAVFAQIARNWLLLHAVGVDASLFDAIAVLIAVVALGQLPFGLSVGTAASVLILGPQGVAAAAAAGLLLTATGTVGGLCFAAWGGLDALPGDRLKALAARVARLPAAAASPWPALADLPAPRRSSIERSYFGGLTHPQIVRVLGIAAA
jgi:hypothetical protein